MELEGRCALITGAASGLGWASAQALHARGAAVLLAGINAGQARDLAGTLGERALSCLVDVRNTRHIEEAIALASAHFATVHIVVNCAGIARLRRRCPRERPTPGTCGAGSSTSTLRGLSMCCGSPPLG